MKKMYKVTLAVNNMVIKIPGDNIGRCENTGQIIIFKTSIIGPNLIKAVIPSTALVVEEEKEI